MVPVAPPYAHAAAGRIRDHPIITKHAIRWALMTCLLLEAPLQLLRLTPEKLQDSTPLCLAL